MNEKKEISLFDNNLIFVTSYSYNEEAYTTDIAIAKALGFSKKYVDRKIRTHYKRLSKLGKRDNRIPALDVKSKSGQNMKVYKLNQKQAIALCNTFDNSEEVLDFKFKLADAFIDAIDLLNERKNQHALNKPVTKSLLDAIKSNKEITGKWAYSNVQKLIYKKVLGISVNQFRAKKDIPSSNSLSRYISTEQGRMLQQVENIVIPYLAINYGYEDIKSIINSIHIG